jgi:hypothetical protein
MMMRFSDGVTFDTSGPLRIESRADGLYVVGQGMLCPVADRAEAEALLTGQARTKEEAERDRIYARVAKVRARLGLTDDEMVEGIQQAVGRVLTRLGSHDHADLLRTLTGDELRRVDAELGGDE